MDSSASPVQTSHLPSCHVDTEERPDDGWEGGDAADRHTALGGDRR